MLYGFRVFDTCFLLHKISNHSNIKSYLTFKNVGYDSRHTFDNRKYKPTVKQCVVTTSINQSINQFGLIH